jgi:hypothetical protein
MPTTAVLRRVLASTAVGCLLALGASASAQAADFTWSGSGSSSNWSESANWLGGTAPTASSSLGIVSFPAAGTPRVSTNDLSGLSLNQLQVGDSAGYSLGGQALTLGIGGLSVTASEGPGVFKLTNPLALSSSQTWTVAGSNGPAPDVEIAGQLTGSSSALTINLSNYRSFTLGEQLGSTSVDDELGNVVINGVEKTEADGTNFKTPVELQAKLNATDGHSVSVNHVVLTSEAAVGPLSASSSWLGLKGSAGPVTLHSSVLGADEILSTPSISFDSGSEFIDVLSHEGSTAGTDYGQIKASGPVTLGGAALVLEDQFPEASRECGPPVVGRVYTLISASSITGQFAEVPDGGTAIAFCAVFGGSGPTFGIVSERAYAYRINYNTASSPQTVTATSLAGVPEPTPAPTPGPGPSTTMPTTTTPPPSAIYGTTTGAVSGVQLAAALRRQLVPSGKTTKIPGLLKHGGLSMPFTALTGGTLTIGWYELPPGAKLARKVKPVLVASGKRTFSAAGTGAVTVKLTSAGKRLLRHAKRLKLVAKGAFVGSGNASAVVTRGFTVRR